MGGGDLNMKKSWHPLLLKNQERVWLEEKKAVRSPSVIVLLQYIRSDPLLTARGEKETRPATQGKRGRASTTGTPTSSGAADR
jgi:hypothetical protein